MEQYIHNLNSLWFSRRVKPRLFCCYGLITRTQRKKRRRGNHLSTLTFFFFFKSQTSQVVWVVSWRTGSWAQSCSKNSIQVPVICFFLGPWNLHLPECQSYWVVCHLREHWLSTYPVFPEWLWLRHYSLVPPKKTRKCFWCACDMSSPVQEEPLGAALFKEAHCARL